jgi:flagellar motor switch protein FliG
VNAEGINKAALLLMSLGEDEAAEAFRFLDPREVQKISIAMAALKNVTHSAVDAVLQDFIKEAETHTTLSLDSKEYIRSVLTWALGEDKAGNVIDRIMQGDDVGGIEGLKWMDAPAVAELIKNEHPQIIATIPGQSHEKLFTHNGLRMGVVNCCEEALTLGFAKSREWCGRRIRAVEFARRVWGPEGPACTHPGA